jgi:hypothetical protein
MSRTSRAIEIVQDTAAFVRSTATTVAAAAAGFAVFIAGVTQLDVVPDEYTDEVAVAAAIASGIAVVARQLIAWLDPKNLSFGRVEVEVDPGADEPGDSDGSGMVPEENVEPLPPNEPDIDEETANAPAEPEAGQD